MLGSIDMNSPRARSRDKHGRFAREKSKNGSAPGKVDTVQEDAARRDAVSTVPVMGNIERLPTSVLTGDERELQKEIDCIFDTPEIRSARAVVEPGVPLGVMLGRLRDQGHGTDVALQAIASETAPKLHDLK